ncbi:MAG: hypothetical protein U1D41_09885 [Nitrosomonas sp.]|nr:hypothetical protein [Nitrosomonas sp.]MDP3662018.1 hypothetical protein [Nitrosomonas sp.]MDZ4106447.1 hypothetical protein [Nitrosomonas sp.]
MWSWKHYFRAKQSTVGAPPERGVGAGRTAHSSGVRTCAPLLFARNAIVVAIHLDVGTIPQEVGGFGTRSHL